MAQGASNRTAIPTPPRLTGDYATDSAGIVQYLHQFYQASVVQSGLLDPAFQLGDPPEIDPANLPEPTSSTISRAQQVANAAYLIAADASARALALTVDFSLSDTDNQVTLRFTNPLEDDKYRVLVQATDYSNAPVAEAFIVTRILRTAEQVVIDFADAPGSGSSVSYTALFFPVE